MTDRMHLVPVVGTGASAAMVFNILPVFLGKAAESFSLSAAAAGWLGTIYLFGFGLSSVSASLWLRRFNRKALVQAFFLVAALLLAMGSVIESYGAVSVTLFAVGLVLGGLYTLSFVLAGEYPNPTRAVGIKLGGEVALGALLLSLIPTFVYPVFGFAGMLLSLAAVLILVSPCTFFVSPWAGEGRMNAVESGARAAIPPPALAALGALFLFTVGQAAVWSFVERAGTQQDYDGAAIGGVLSTAVLLGGVGSFLAGAVSDRFGSAKPLLFALSIYLVSMALFGMGQRFWVYAGAINLFFFAWLFALPYLVSVIAALDDSGRATSLVTACLAFGSMLGPGIGGQMLSDGDFGLLYLTGAVVTIIAYVMVLAVVRGRLAARRGE